MCVRAFIIVAMLAASLPAATAGEEKTIVFVCLHGVVNSQMAAAYFNKVAKERGLPFTAVSRGIDLYRSVPVRIQDGLALDGLAPANAPLELTAEEAGRWPRAGVRHHSRGAEGQHQCDLLVRRSHRHRRLREGAR